MEFSTMTKFAVLFVVVLATPMIRCDTELSERVLRDSGPTDLAKDAASFTASLYKFTEAIKDISENRDDLFVYVKKISNIFRTVSPMVGGLAGIVEISILIAGGGASKSAELEYMEKEFPKVHTCLTSISNQLASLTSAIDFQTSQINLHDAETSIKESFRDMMKMMEKPKTKAKKDFLRYYNNRDINKLFSSIIDIVKGSLISVNGALLPLYETAVGCDIGKMEAYSSRVIQLLMVALQVKTTFHKIKETKAKGKREKLRQAGEAKDAEERVIALMPIFLNVSKNCTDHLASVIDREVGIVLNDPKKNSYGWPDFADSIVQHLDKKLYLYQYLVIVHEFKNLPSNLYATVGKNIVEVELTAINKRAVVMYRDRKPEKAEKQENQCFYNAGSAWNDCSKTAAARTENAFPCFTKELTQEPAGVYVLTFSPTPYSDQRDLDSRIGVKSSPKCGNSMYYHSEQKMTCYQQTREWAFAK